jgi:hypothetical protein
MMFGLAVIAHPPDALPQVFKGCNNGLGNLRWFTVCHSKHAILSKK